MCFDIGPQHLSVPGVPTKTRLESSIQNFNANHIVCMIAFLLLLLQVVRRWVSHRGGRSTTPSTPPLRIKIAQTLDLRCVLLSGPGTFGAGAKCWGKTRLESRIKKLKRPFYFHIYHIFYLQTKTVDVDTGADLPRGAGSRGELLARSSLVMLEYYNKPEKTMEASALLPFCPFGCICLTGLVAISPCVGT